MAPRRRSAAPYRVS